MNLILKTLTWLILSTEICMHEQHVPFPILLSKSYVPGKMSGVDFSDSFMIFEPEKVGLVDLFHILFSRSLERREFWQSSGCQKPESHHGRWLIFLSLLAQKTLIHFATPMQRLGSLLELWLNLPSCNGGFRRLLLNLLTGKLEQPDKSSPTFLSFVGRLNPRVELDRSIKPGDGKYLPALAAMASKVSYENRSFVESTVVNHWKMNMLGFYNFRNEFQMKATTQAFMFHDTSDYSDTIVVAFRGTGAFDAAAWCTDVDISWIGIQGMGKIHGGFMKALGLRRDKGWPNETGLENEEHNHLAYYEIRDTLWGLLGSNDVTKVILTGHSLGGALAILFAAVLAHHKESLILDRLEGVYTFGQPRVGDVEFKEFMEFQFRTHDVSYLRFVYNNDVVPRLPTDNSAFMFKHFGKCVHFNAFYKAKIITDVPSGYWTPFLVVLPRMICSMWELVRGFILPFTLGPDYRESFIMIWFRVLGILFPGISNHCPQNYINSTRLATEDIYMSHQNQPSQHDNQPYVGSP